MRVVVDTNVLVSGLLTPWGPAGEIVRLIVSGELALLHDGRIITEYREVLGRSEFPFAPGDVVELMAKVSAFGEAVASDSLLKRLSDHDDEAFLEAALGGGAEALVTGNARHFPKEIAGKVPILSPSEFLEFYRRARKPRGPEPT